MQKMSDVDAEAISLFPLFILAFFWLLLGNLSTVIALETCQEIIKRKRKFFEKFFLFFPKITNDSLSFASYKLLYQ